MIIFTICNLIVKSIIQPLKIKESYFYETNTLTINWQILTKKANMIYFIIYSSKIIILNHLFIIFLILQFIKEIYKKLIDIM